MKRVAGFLQTSLSILCLLITLFFRDGFANEGEKANISLISESKTVGNCTNIILGLKVHIESGWKTYWRSPGASGYGVNLSWKDSKNIKSAKLLWPLPTRSDTIMGPVNAYMGDQIFPILVEISDPSQPVHASVQVDMLVCDEENCLPIMKTLILDLPPGAKRASKEAQQIKNAILKIPKIEAPEDLKQQDISLEKVTIQDIDHAPPVLQVTLNKTKGKFSLSELPQLFMEIKDQFVDAPRTFVSKDLKTIQFTAHIYPDESKTPTPLPALVGKLVTLTFGYQNDAFEIAEVIEAGNMSYGFWGGMLLIAFIGGLILNIMPCVLPVLSLKILSVIRHGGGHRKNVRREFLATVLGIIFSFMVLATGAILLKLSGHAVGWGVQFQEPYFLIGLIGVLTLFACNLFGFFEFRLPSFLSSLGGIRADRENMIGSFLEGSLVTALATPCTAPFLGTALAFALSRGTIEIVSIFLFMGLGLSFPFLLIAFFPKFATKLPKPGEWMIKLRYVLGFLVLLTAIWLVYVLIAEIGKTGAMVVGMMMLLISLFLKKTQNGTEARKRMAWLAACILILASFVLPTFVNKSVTSGSVDQRKLWRPFEPEMIANYVKSGKRVIVNVTADWCLTCQANKYFVLKALTVLNALKEQDVVAMEADWTNHDPKITAYLKTFNQYGIPFYAVYGCQNQSGKFLGQILTPKKVVDALENEKCPLIK